MTLNEIVALVLPFLLFILKELCPYIMKKYKAKKPDGTYNKEQLSDINSDFVHAVFLFPTDILVVSVGYIFSRIVIQSNLIAEDISNDITLLHFNYFLLIIMLFIMLPVCVWATRKCASLYFSHRKVIKGIICCALLYIVAFVVDLLFYK